MAPTADRPTRVVEDIQDIYPGALMMSERKHKKWENGETVWADLYYKNRGTKLMFNITDVRTIFGITINPNFRNGYMNVMLSDEQSKLVRERLDDEILRLCFERRGEFLRKNLPITKASELRIMYQGVVRDGDERPEGGKYNDKILSNVQTKKRGQQCVFDDNACTVEDVDGVPLPITALERSNLKEVVIEIDKVVFKDTSIRVNTRVCLIVADTTVAPKIMTKRKLSMLRELPLGTSDTIKPHGIERSPDEKTQQQQQQQPQAKRARVEVVSNNDEPTTSIIDTTPVPAATIAVV